MRKKSIRSKIFWDAVLCKLVEQFVSVKLWVMAFASILVWKLVGILIEIKDVTLSLSIQENVSNDTIVSLLTSWFGKILDINLAFFTAVIVVVLLSRETFKHSQIQLEKKEPETISDIDKIKNSMV